MSEETRVTLRQERDYRFAVDFGEGRPAVHTDEDPPLGAGSGPGPLHLLLAATANCMASSLLFALRKYREDGGTITAEAEGRVARSPRGRLRVESIVITLRLGVKAETIAHLDRIASQFEDFCTVGQSVRRGIPTTVRLLDVTGTEVPGLVTPPD